MFGATGSHAQTGHVCCIVAGSAIPATKTDPFFAPNTNTELQQNDGWYTVYFFASFQGVFVSKFHYPFLFVVGSRDLYLLQPQKLEE